MWLKNSESFVEVKAFLSSGGGYGMDEGGEDITTLGEGRRVRIIFTYSWNRTARAHQFMKRWSRHQAAPESLGDFFVASSPGLPCPKSQNIRDRF